MISSDTALKKAREDLKEIKTCIESDSKEKI